MTRIHFTALLVSASVAATSSTAISVAAAQTENQPCGGFRLSEGQVITERAIAASFPLSDDSKACLGAIARAVAERPYIRSLTVAARLPADRRTDGKGLAIARAAKEVMTEAGVDPRRLSIVAPAIGHGQAAGLFLVYREGRRNRRVARVLETTGAIRIGPLRDAMRKARKGDIAVVYDYLESKADSSCLLLLADGSLVLVGQKTRLRLGPIELTEDYKRHVQVELFAGELHTVASLGKGGVRFEINTRTAVAGVRGTTFRTAVDRGDITRVETLEGAVELARAGATADSEGQSVTVEAEFGSLVDQGQPPIQPRRLLLAPAIASPRLGTFAAPPALRWRAVAGAVAYRVELARDARFSVERSQWREQTTNATIRSAGPTGRRLGTGKWFWRVMAIDADGFIGLPSKIYAFEVRP
ncbi:MAG: FecR family protein [Proteobacteria bacterium]|nr:FecR family protein [Pseudomonadota bacterium]